MKRIKNSIRVEPNRLKEEVVARGSMLQQEHCNVQVIKGGMKAWIKAGGEIELVLEGDVRHLPHFD